ncbi:MAG: DMT family transporter [Desulfocapsa sp.]|nr:DMT family transporter [Desulfocapsa sp.]
MTLCEPCLYFIFEALALKNTSASQASVITIMLPLLISVASAIFLAEKFSTQNLTGLFLAMAGGVGPSIEGEINAYAPAPLLGNFYEFPAMVCATVYTIAVKRLTSRYSPLFLTAVQAWIGALFFGPMLLLPDIPIPDSLLVYILYLPPGIIGGISFNKYQFTIRAHLR